MGKHRVKTQAHPRKHNFSCGGAFIAGPQTQNKKTPSFGQHTGELLGLTGSEKTRNWEGRLSAYVIGLVEGESVKGGLAFHVVVVRVQVVRLVLVSTGSLGLPLLVPL